MPNPAFPGIEPVHYQGPDSSQPLAFKYYDKNRIVRGKRMEDHLRMAVCYWHTFVWNGFDVFGAGTFGRTWHRDGDAVELAKEKADAAALRAAALRAAGRKQAWAVRRQVRRPRRAPRAQAGRAWAERQAAAPVKQAREALPALVRAA